MTDIVNEEKRSEMMAGIRSSDTKPEKIVRSLLHRMGYRFRIHKKIAGCKPDVVLPKYKTAIFVHGCFWHQHPGCRFAYNPKSKVEFWKKKFLDNQERDARNEASLIEAGWKVVTIWECETKNIESLADILQMSLR